MDSASPDRVKAALVGLAVEDCMGAPVEGWPPELIHDTYGEDAIPLDSVWTDDTQQALVLLEAFLRTGRPDPEWIGRRFVQMARQLGVTTHGFGLHRRFGSGFRAAVESFAMTGDWRTSGGPSRAETVPPCVSRQSLRQWRGGAKTRFAVLWWSPHSLPIGTPAG